MIMYVHIESFGYLHGAPPANSDLILDARDLIRDPHVDPALRQLTGRDEAVHEAVMGTPGAGALAGFIRQAVKVGVDGDAWFRVAIGCQGGRHRSVVLADVVGEALAERDGAHVQIYHRDIDRPVVERSTTCRKHICTDEAQDVPCGRMLINGVCVLDGQHDEDWPAVQQ